MPRRDLISLRHGTSAEWSAADPVLAEGEPGYDETTGLWKVGDGAAAWSALRLAGAPYDGIPLTSSDFVADAGATPAVSTNVPGWQFGSAADQGIVTSFPIAAHWTAFTVIIAWAKLAAVAGNVVWRVQLKDLRLFIDTLPKAPFVDEAQTVAAPGTNLQVTGSTFAADTPIPSTFAGAIYTLRIVREGSNVLDTLAADVLVPTVLVARTR